MTSEFLPVDDLGRLRRRRSAKWRMHPPDVLPLPVAEMDFGIAEPIRSALHEAVDRGDLGYAYPTRSLGEAIAGFAERRWGWTIDPDDVRAVSDVNAGTNELASVLIRPGQRAIISPPVYPPFFEWMNRSGGEPTCVPMARRSDGSYCLDLDALERAFQLGPAVYLLCNPHNPVGSVPSPGELADLAALAARYDVRVISDEIHAQLVLPGARFTPFLAVPGGADVGVSLVSASKTWNLAGLKCAVIVAASDRGRATLAALPADLGWEVGHLGVIAAEAAFTAGDAWLDSLLLTLAERRRQLAEMLADRLPRIALTPACATYFAWLDCRALGAGDEPRRLFYDRGLVALDSGPDFGAEGSGFVRLNFATSAEILDEATARMAAALGKPHVSHPTR